MAVVLSVIAIILFVILCPLIAVLISKSILYLFQVITKESIPKIVSKETPIETDTEVPVSELNDSLRTVRSEEV